MQTAEKSALEPKRPQGGALSRNLYYAWSPVVTYNIIELSASASGRVEKETCFFSLFSTRQHAGLACDGCDHAGGHALSAYLPTKPHAPHRCHLLRIDMIAKRHHAKSRLHTSTAARQQLTYGRRASPARPGYSHRAPQGWPTRPQTLAAAQAAQDTKRTARAWGSP